MLYIYIFYTGVLFFAGRVANTALFCSSDDLVVSLDNPTHFCNITGAYGLV